MSDSFEAQGFAVIPGVLAESECQRILGVVLEQRQSEARLRACLTHTWCQELAISLRQHDALVGIIARTVVAVQWTLFETIAGWFRGASAIVSRRLLHFLFGPPTPTHGLRWV